MALRPFCLYLLLPLLPGECTKCLTKESLQRYSRHGWWSSPWTAIKA